MSGFVGDLPFAGRSFFIDSIRVYILLALRSHIAEVYFNIYKISFIPLNISG